MGERYVNALAALRERYVGALTALRGRFNSATRGLSAIAGIQSPG